MGRWMDGWIEWIGELTNKFMIPSLRSGGGKRWKNSRHSQLKNNEGKVNTMTLKWQF